MASTELLLEVEQPPTIRTQAKNADCCYVGNHDRNTCYQCFLFIFFPIWKLFNFIVSYSLIYSIISELLLLVNIYSTDPLFFGLSISFLIIPLLFVSSLTCLVSRNDRIKMPCIWGLYCPIINIAYFWSVVAIGQNKMHKYLKAIKSAMSSILTGLMTFPLYIVNLSYLLENADSFDNISIFNYLQLLFSLINLTITPIQMFVNHQLHERKGQVNATNYSNNLNTCKLYLLYTFYAYPMALIEVIHFFPFLFLYYIDEQIVISQLVIILCIFNIPKILFVVHVAKKMSSECDNKQMVFLVYIPSILIFITVPLIPYIAIMIGKEKANDIVGIFDKGCYSSVSKYYWNIVFYLLISYGGSTIYTIIVVGGLNQFSWQVQMAFGVFLVLIVLIVITLPIAFYYIKKEFMVANETSKTVL